MFDETAKKEIISGLLRLGLRYNESLVYISLLKLGETGSSKIIDNTGLHGQYVYQSLGQLERRGLAQHVVKRGRKKFSAKNPDALKRLVEQQKTIADDVTAKLKEILVMPAEQTFEVFQGRESYVAHEFDMLERAKNDSEALVIGGMGDKFNQTMGERLKEYAALQKRKNVRIRYLGSDSQRPTMQYVHGKRELFEIKYLPGLFTAEVNTNVWPDALAFNIFSEPVTHFTIWNPLVAASYRQFFETLWKLAKP